MKGSGVILFVLVALWALALLPALLRRHDEASESRSVDRFSLAMRILSRRTPEVPNKRYVVMPARPASARRPLVMTTREAPAKGWRLTRLRRAGARAAGVTEANPAAARASAAAAAGAGDRRRVEARRVEARRVDGRRADARRGQRPSEELAGERLRGEQQRRDQQRRGDAGRGAPGRPAGEAGRRPDRQGQRPATGSRRPADRRQRGRASLAVRRRRLLLALCVLTVVAFGAALALGGLWWGVACFAAALVFGYLVHLRAETQRRAAIARRRRRQAGRTVEPADDAAGVPLRRPARQRTTTAATEPAPAAVESPAASAAAQAESWDPVDVPLPTYVTKPAAPRRVEVEMPGTWNALFDQEELEGAPARVSGAADADADGDELAAIIERRRAVGD